MRITEVSCECRGCGWTGTVLECEPDVDGDGGLGCPICFCVVTQEKVQPSLGIVYVAFGRRAEREVKKSIRSLQNHNDIPVTVVDQSTFGDPGPGARWAKLNMDRLVDYERVLYLDADTRVCGDLSVGFELLNDWDLVLTPSKYQDGNLFAHIRGDEEKQETLREIENPSPLQLQAGVMFFDRGRCARLFEIWREEWQRWRDQDQAALLRALKRSPVRVWLLGRCWNGGELVEHRFGKAR